MDKIKPKLHFQIPSIDCQDQNILKKSSVCTNSYEMDRKLTSAKITRIRKKMECTQELGSRNYNATFCFNLPEIGSKEVGATLIFPKLKETCKDFTFMPPPNCQVKMRQKCIFEPTVVDEMQTFLQCRIEQNKQTCKKVPSIA